VEPYDGSKEFCYFIKREENEFYYDFIFLFIAPTETFLLNVKSLFGKSWLFCCWI